MSMIKRGIFGILFLSFFFAGSQAYAAYCSNIKRGSDTSNLETYAAMYDQSGMSQFKNQYISKFFTNWTDTISGQPTWYNNNDLSCPNGLGFINNERSDWQSRWTSARLAGAGVADNVNTAPISIAQMQKMQIYIKDHCGLSLSIDGHLGKKTVNSVKLCTWATNNKITQKTFEELAVGKAFCIDDKCTKPLVDINNNVIAKVTSDAIYVDPTNAVAKSKGITDAPTAQTQGLKITTTIPKLCSSNTQIQVLSDGDYAKISSSLKEVSNKCCYAGKNVETGPNQDPLWSIKGTQATATIGSIVIDVCSVLPQSSCSQSPAVGFVPQSSQNKKEITDFNAGKKKDSCECLPGYKQESIAFVDDKNPQTQKNFSICRKCDPVTCNCGVKLNTNVPFIGRCIVYGMTNDTNDTSYTSGDDSTIVVNPLNAFPVLMTGIVKILMTVILLLCFGSLIVAGVMMTIPGQYDTGKSLIWKVVYAIALLGVSGIILYLINPNFFF